MVMQKESEKQAQVDRLRAYLLSGRTINPLEAWKALGIYREDGATITTGLAANDWIVANGVHKLQPGQAIKPIDRDNRPVAP